MMTEIEAKFKIHNPAEVREKLLSCQAEHVQTVLQEDTYLDTDERQLYRNDTGLRLRTVKKINPKGPDDKQIITLTYKGPRREGDLKIREEQEVIVNSADTTLAILARLGYHPTISFQKRRESFKLKNAQIELDELPQMGFFLEIEADDEQIVQSVRELLGLANSPTITKTYAELVAEYLNRNSSQEQDTNKKLYF